nr:hypothetical protein BaRGS_007121 [Batillaria attramentaria]
MDAEKPSGTSKPVPASNLQFKQSKKYSFDDKRKLKELIQKKKGGGGVRACARKRASKARERERGSLLRYQEFSPDLANAKTTDKAFEQARRKAVAAGEQPADEGVELMDCEGDEIPEDELVHELVDDGEPEVDDLAAPPAISSPLQSSKPGADVMHTWRRLETVAGSQIRRSAS